ncbi:FAD-binding protein [Streptomyces sp. FXJ1.4098]|nr:FAD-binding protein [Streptomyces sp. FXJ1.4098]
MGTPDHVWVVGSTEQVVAAVQEAVDSGKRIAVRSGGHCAEGWVDDPAVRVLIDMSGMTQVSYDPARRAFAVEPGATLGEVYRRLVLGWGVTIPAGWCPGVGAGGHVCGVATVCCPAPWGWSWTICTPLRSWWSTDTARRRPWSPRVRRVTRTASCGGAIPGAVAETSAW